MVFLKDLVEVSEKVGSTTRKKEKVSILASFLKPARGREIALAASYLAGRIPQGRLGVGWATLQEALKGLTERVQPLSLMEVNQTFQKISDESGPGSAEEKVRHLRELFSGGGKEEKDFLIRLILGEIRQGALEGLILEAIAGASSVPPERVRQGLMFSGDIGEVARAALEEGAAGLTDEMLRWQTERLLQLEVSRDEFPVYVKPELVAEIAYSDIQESPRYPGGLALRFARVKSYREDKSPLEADTIQKVRAIFESRRK